MRELLLDLIDAASRHADYADARFTTTRSERISTRNGAVDRLELEQSRGIGVRVRVGEAWSFAAAREPSRESAHAALARALEVARAQAPANGAPLAPEPVARGSWRSALERDPFEVPSEDKLSVLLAADAGMRTDPAVKVVTARYEAVAVEKLFASTEGALCEQHTTECGGGLAAVAIANGESQVRSYPASHGGHVAQAGFEHFMALDLPGRAGPLAEEAVALLSAPTCPARRSTLILADEQLGLQIHESIGHAVELDRILGHEASYAGTSFLPVAGIGSFRLGSDAVSVSADATAAGGLGSFRWDDEGVEGRSVPIVEDGILCGFLSSRETAAAIGLERSGGCMRAEGFARQPIVRMTNVNLEPGEAGSLDDLIADTEDGLLIENNRSWSIDDRRLHFQFEGEAAVEIKHGRRGRLLRNPSYAGTTPEFWAGCDAVCSRQAWGLVSLLDCGKGEPGQVIRVSHGSAPARFRGVDVGVA